GPPDGSAILLCDRPAFRIASVRARLGAPTDIAELEAELLDRIPEHARGRRRGSLWHACEGDPAPLEAEHFVELVAPVTDPRVITRTLPALVAACTFSIDDESAAHHAFAEMRQWMTRQGSRLAG